MPCTRPLEATRRSGSGDKPTIWKKGTRPKVLADGIEALDLPCGQCFKCRLEHSRIWAARIVQEDYMHFARGEDSLFVTFTYREPWHCTPEQKNEGLHCPGDGSLDHSHFQKFMKRLRKHFGDRRIRYYQCGEYGDETNRPHYHAILYNVSFPDQELMKQQNGYSLFVSETLDKLWKYGYCWFGSVSFDSAAYVARYCMKKITGTKAHDHYLRHDEYGNEYWLKPEYSTMSKGIGKEFYEEYKTDLYPESQCPIPGRGVYGKPPRYFDKLHTISHPEEMEEVKEARKKWFEDHYGEITPQHLDMMDACAKARMKHKRRAL